MGFSSGPKHPACSCINSGSISFLTSWLWVPSESQNVQPGRKQRRNVYTLHSVHYRMWTRDEAGDGAQLPISGLQDALFPLLGTPHLVDYFYLLLMSCQMCLPKSTRTATALNLTQLCPYNQPAPGRIRSVNLL